MQKLCFVLGVSDPSKHTHKNEKNNKKNAVSQEEKKHILWPFEGSFLDYKSIS